MRSLGPVFALMLLAAASPGAYAQEPEQPDTTPAVEAESPAEEAGTAHTHEPADEQPSGKECKGMMGHGGEGGGHGMGMGMGHGKGKQAGEADQHKQEVEQRLQHLEERLAVMQTMLEQLLNRP